MSEPARTYEEWRVTGRSGGHSPPYEFVWSRVKTPEHGDPELAARHFLELIGRTDSWEDGPHLSHRTVTVTEWRPA